MKKFLTLFAVAIVCMSANAQIQFGGKVGFDLTNFWGKNVGHGMKPGYQFGLMMEYKFGDKIAIAPEVVFAAQGGKFDVDAVVVEPGAIYFGTGKVTTNTNYINVPVMFKYYVNPEISIDFGPQVGFNVYSKYSIKDIDGSIDYKDATKGVDFGLGLGCTYNLTEHAFVQARYTLGMTKAFKSLKIAGEEINNEKNSNFQIAFGMKF